MMSVLKEFLMVLLGGIILLLIISPVIILAVLEQSIGGPDKEPENNHIIELFTSGKEPIQTWESDGEPVQWENTVIFTEAKTGKSIRINGITIVTQIEGE